MALWGDEGSSKMVNQQSQVFEANVEEVDVDALPRLKGPDDQSDLVVRMFRDLVPIFKAVDMRIEQLELTPRGSWRVLTDGGAQLELGRGTEAEMVAQLKIFFRTLSQITARYGRTPSSAELGAQVARGPLGDVGAPFWPELSRFEAEHRCTTLDCSFSHFTLDCLRCRRAPREGYVRLLERMLNPSGANNLL